MKVRSRAASCLPIASRTARARTARGFVLILRYRCRLTTSMGSICGQPRTLNTDLLGVLVVGANDHLYKMVPNNVLIVELNKGNSINISDDALSFNKTGFASV